MYNLDLCQNPNADKSAFGISALEPCDVLPKRLVPFNVAMSLNRVSVGSGVHFYLDDYQFERVWNAPERYVEALRRFDCVLTPDFSLYLDMPKAMKMWNIYRSRLIGRFWQENGINVIPSLSWAEPESFSFCFDGLPTNATLAVARIGVDSNPYCRYIWEIGFREAMLRLHPKNLIFYTTAKAPSPELPNTRILNFGNSRLSALRASQKLRPPIS